MFYYNPGNDSWGTMPFMLKEHTVYREGWAATMVIVPFGKKNKDGEEVTVFIPMGVRIESLNRPTTRNLMGRQFYLPGYSYFFKNKTGMISETDEWSFHTDRCGQPFYKGMYPEVKKPKKVKGVPVAEHRRGEFLARMAALAKESYAEWVAAQRAAA